MMHPDFNSITSQRFIANPYPILADLRASNPVLKLAPGLVESYHVFRYDDARQILLDRESFSSDRSLLGGGAIGDANLAFLFNNMISATGEKHRRLRMIGNQVFLPKRIETFRPQVQAVVDERMEIALSGGEFDLVEEFSAQITVAMITTILGLPRDDMPRIREWAAVLGANSGASIWLPDIDPELTEKGRRTALAMTEYFIEYLEARRRCPREGDLLSDFMAVEVEGERLTNDEVLSMVMLLLLAGNETTTNLITNLVRSLDAFPAEAARLRADPDLVPSAVEETLRMRNSIRNIDRFATRELELRGVTIPERALVVVWLAAANRDPEIFHDPDRFVADRTPNRHLAFSIGIHTCLGAPLARMEAQIVARAIMERTEAIELTAPPELGMNANFDNIIRQPVRFVPAEPGRRA